MNYSRRRKRLKNAAGAGTRRTQTSPKNRRADARMGRKSITETRSALTSTTAVNRTPTAKSVTKTRAATGSETRIKTKDEPKTGTERRTERGKRTRRETKTEKGREIGILTETEKETGKNEETETKSGRKRESGTKTGTRGTKVERGAIAKYVT